MVKKNDILYYEAVGRRRESVARVRLYIAGKDKSITIKSKKIDQGEIMVNDKTFNKAFTDRVAQKRCLLPFELTNSVDRFAVSIKVNGGGQNGQLEAIIHGISRALLKVNPEENRLILRQNNLLTRDSRTRERRKVGTGGKARRAKQSPKR